MNPVFLGMGLGACGLSSASGTAAPPLSLWTVPVKSQSFGGAAVADADGDGGADVAFGAYFGDATARVLRGTDGSCLWSYRDPDPGRPPSGDCYDASCKFADVTGDRSLDLVVPCSSACRVLCFEAKTGRVQWNTFVGDGDCIDTPPWVGDADGDGTTDVVVGTFRSRMHVLRGTDGALIRTVVIADSGAVQSCPIPTDCNGDGTLDFVGAIFGRKDRGVYAVDGKSGERLWRVETGDSIYHGPAFGPFGVARDDRLLASCYDGKVYIIRPSDGRLDMAVTTGERYLMSPITLVDLDADAGGSVDAVSASDHVVVIGADGTIRRTDAIAPAGRSYETVSRGVAVADLNGDSRPDLAWVTSRGYFRAATGATGEVIAEFDAGQSCGTDRPAGNGSHGPVLADLNGDGKLDVFFVVGGGGVRSPDGTQTDPYGAAVCLTGFEGVAGVENSWPMFRRDHRNTGFFSRSVFPAR